MQFRRERAGTLLEFGVIRIGVGQIGGAALGRREGRQRPGATEGRHVEGIGFELDDRHRSLLDRALLDRAVAHHEKRAKRVLQDDALAGDIDRALRLVALVLDEDALERPVRAPLADVEHEIIADRHEGAFLDEARDEIGVDVGDHLARRLQRARHEIERHHAHDDGGEEAERQRRLQQRDRRGAAGIDDDEFRIGVELVQRVDDADQHGDGADDQQQAGENQARDLREGHEALALRGDEIELAQSLAQPHRAGQAAEAEQERCQHAFEDISPDQRHLRTEGSGTGSSRRHYRGKRGRNKPGC